MSEAGGEMRPASRRRGLGMGLSALLGSHADAMATGAGDGVRRIPIEYLRPSPLQPRRRFADDELAALAESLRERGVVQPLLVRRAPNGGEHYEIVAGERRWRAAQQAGLHELPVVIYELSDQEALEVALLENVQRQDLSPIEEAEGYQRLIDEFGHTQEELARVVGKSRSHLANTLRLLALPAVVRDMLEAGSLSAGHARALLSADDPAALARLVVERGLNVRQTEALVRADAGRQKPAGARRIKDADILALERDLASRLGLMVEIRPRGAGGKLSITYRSLDQLENVVSRLRRGEPH